MGEHEDGKEGNLWDHLIRDETTTTADDGNTDSNSDTTPVNGYTEGNGTSNTKIDGDGNTDTDGNGNTNTDGNGSVNSDGNGNTNTLFEAEAGKPTATDSTTVTTQVLVKSEEIQVTDTVKYLIVFLSVISIALIIVVGYIAMRMCTRRSVKPTR